MNIKSIKNKADELLLSCKPQLTRILLIVTLLGLVPTLFSELGMVGGLLSTFVSLIFLTVQHGGVVASLKVVRNNSQSLKDDDAGVGFQRFKALFPTYALLWVIVLAVSFVGGIIIAFPILGSVFTLNSSTDVLSAIIPFLGVLIILMIILVIVIYWIELNLFATPYLLEKYGIETMRAIKESYAFMKGHKMDLFRLDLSFLGWLFLQGCIIGVFSALFSAIPFLGTVIGGTLAAVFGVYTFVPRYELSKAIFFEEIAYVRYGGNHTQENASESNVEEDVYVEDENPSETKGE